jgi:hypothetical protein
VFLSLGKGIDLVIETLTTGCMIHSRTNSPPVEVSHTPSSQCFYHWFDTSTGGLLVLDDIIHPVVSVYITGSIPLLVDY